MPHEDRWAVPGFASKPHCSLRAIVKPGRPGQRSGRISPPIRRGLTTACTLKWGFEAKPLEAINARCLTHGIPRPVTFAYPGNSLDEDVLPLLHGLGIRFARRGGRPN